MVVESATFGNAGDSGSLIVKADTAQPTALLFGGDSTTGFAVANPIQDVLAALPDPANQALPTIVGGATHAVGGCVPGGNNSPSSQPLKRSPSLSLLSDAVVARAAAVKSAHLAEWTADPAVLGVGIGAGEAPGEAAVVVFVARGKSIPHIPAIVQGVKVKVKTIGPIKAYGRSICPRVKPFDLTLPSLR